MTASNGWTETLRCPDCALAGLAQLGEPSVGDHLLVDLPDGFRAVSTQYGYTFYCEACNRPARDAISEVRDLAWPMRPGTR